MEPGRERRPRHQWLQDKPVDTNWDPAQYTARHRRPDLQVPGDRRAYVSDYGAASGAADPGVHERRQADPPLATLASSNELGCLYRSRRRTGPTSRWSGSRARTRVVRWAARRALATFNEIELEDPTLLKMFPFVDTTAGKEPECRTDLPPDADLSSGLTPEELKELFG